MNKKKTNKQKWAFPVKKKKESPEILTSVRGDEKSEFSKRSPGKDIVELLNEKRDATINYRLPFWQKVQLEEQHHRLFPKLSFSDFMIIRNARRF